MIKNLTRKSVLVKNVETASSPWKKTRGLMFRRELASDSGLFMVFERERKHEIWMFGMRFPIDIIFINSDRMVVDIRHSVKPIGGDPKTWRIYKPKQKCKYVLEVNAGLASKTGTEIGDTLSFNHLRV